MVVPRWPISQTAGSRFVFTTVLARPPIVTNEGLGLTSGAPGGKGAVEHIAFQLSGIRDITDRAKSEGIEVIKEPGKGPYGLTVYLSDPDGNTIELFSEEET